MAHFNLENELSNALRLDVPLKRGPVPRWQRKAMETSASDISLSTSGNTSTLMNMTMNKSLTKSSNSPKKDMDEWSKRLTPGRQNASKSPPSIHGDRFIPNRSAMQFELGHHMLSKANGEEENLSPNSSHYQKTMSENLNGDLSNFRILAYQNKAPQAPTGHANALKILYCSSKNPGSTKKATRHIPQAPERILDAPD
ncbi:Cell division cycle protein 20-like protein, partial [Stegodyphus mimosarum]